MGDVVSIIDLTLEGEAEIVVTQQAATSVEVSVQGGTSIELADTRFGPPGPMPEPGPGLKLVGAELRYDISSLTKG